MIQSREVFDMIKIGIVGAGIICGEHTRAIEKTDTCKLTMVADLDLDKAVKAAEPYGAKAFTDYKDFVKDENEKPDAVILNLPHFLHCDVSIFFMSHGVHVLVEKPMAMNVEECDRMIEASKKYNVKLAIGHVQQYIRALDAVKDIIKSGEYGRLTRITELRNTDYFSRRPAWFLDKKLSGGGIVMNYCAHTLDKLFYVTGADILEIHSSLSNYLNDCSIEEGAQIFAKLSGGVSASLTYCGGNVPDETETKFYFTNGAVMIKNNTQLYMMKDKNWELVELEPMLMFERQLEAFINLIEGRETVAITGEYGKKVIAVIEKVYASTVLR